MSDNTGGRGELSSETLPSVWGYTVGKCVCEHVGVCVSVRERKRTKKVIMCCHGSAAVKN